MAEFRPEFQLTTARLVLRAWREDDRPRFAAIMNTPGMMQHLGGVTTRAAMDALIDKRMADMAHGGTCYWAVDLRETGELVATAGLRLARDYPGTHVAGMLEAGWRVAEPWQGRGIAQEAMRAAIDWSWRTRAEAQMATWTRPDNAGSLRLMRRLGFAPAPEFDFDRPGTGERCLVHLLDRPAEREHAA